MCGRFTQISSAQSIYRAFALSNIPEQQPRYNVSPTQEIGTVLKPYPDSEKEFHWFRWGLIPSWAKDSKIGNKTINARAETVAEKPSFRSAFRSRRCLIIADGFYEWQGRKGKKQPYYFQMKDQSIFAFAGLWEKWRSPSGEEIKSCTILTTKPNEIMRPIHHRMPVILDTMNYDLWLDTQVSQPELLKSLFIPYNAEKMSVYPVSTLVNNVRNDSPECVEAIAL